MATSTRILVVGATPDSDALAELLRLEGYAVEQASRSELPVVACVWQPDLVIADVAFPQQEGLQLLQELGSVSLTPRTVVMSSRTSAALDALGVTCLPKPVDLPALWRLLAGGAGAAA
jgi:DNA-binding response OmpR family regulator